MIGYEFRGGRSAATAKLHNVSVGDKCKFDGTTRDIDNALAHGGAHDSLGHSFSVHRISHDYVSNGSSCVAFATVSRPHRHDSKALSEQDKPSERALSERPEDKQWACVGHGHWRCQSKSARAFRSPGNAGVDWSEVYKRTTRDFNNNNLLSEIYPLRDKISEAEACTGFGGCRDIQTDVYLISSLNHGDTLSLRQDSAASPAPQGGLGSSRGANFVFFNCFNFSFGILNSDLGGCLLSIGCAVQVQIMGGTYERGDYRPLCLAKPGFFTQMSSS